MEVKSYNTPAETAKIMIDVGYGKSKLKISSMLVLGFIAGAFIAFASEGSNMAAYNLLADPLTYGMGRALAGAVFGTGLMLVVVAGGELFTGNNLMIIGLFQRKFSLLSMLRNWFFVYIGNFIGAFFIAYLMYHSGLFNSSNGLLGGVTIKIAANKVNLSFMSAISLGIMCNMLVCSAVWMAATAKDIIGKLFACFFPIWLFITSGFEHSVANMYYIPAGIMAKQVDLYVSASTLTPEVLDKLTWSNMILNNLIPVTIGNIIGGCIFIGILYWFVYLKGEK